MVTNEQLLKEGCEILVQAATPDIYRINAFRISGLNVSATTREISNQIQKNQMLEKYGGKLDNHKSLFPIEPPPDVDKLRQALHRLRDPETRIIDEFFWFWPHSIDSDVKDHALDALSRSDIKTAESLWINYEATFTESNVSRHNLAVLSHLLVLDIELNGNSLAKEEIAKRDRYWNDTFKRWKLLLDHEGFWSRLTARVRQMDDPRLTTGFVKRLREALPFAILLINGVMAVEFAEKGKDEEAKRHLNLIQKSGFDNDAIERAVKWAIEPVRKRIKVICLSARDESERNNLRGIEFGKQVLTHTQIPLKILNILLPENKIIIEGAEDDIVDNVFKCYIPYVNKTEDYASALELINSMKNFIESDTSKAKVDQKIKSIKDVLEYSNFWRLKGYFSYPSNCVDLMEKAFDLHETLKFDEAIDLLRKGLYSLPEIQESDSLRKQFLHCIAYCLRRKSVNIYNEAFDEYNSEFDRKYNNLVKYRVYISEYSHMINCAHCYGPIFGTYYTRTINGIKQPFCDSCNNRIDRELKALEKELKKEIKKAFDLILLSKFLSPNHNPTKLDFEVIKESANKRSIYSAEISDLLLNFNLLDMSETIKLLKSGSGEKDSKLHSHLVSILKSQDAKGRLKTLSSLINNHSTIIKDLLPYMLNSDSIFSILIKNEQLFDKQIQIQIQYYEYLHGHWDASLRKRSIKWLNANITDNQAKIKYLIKSLADPDNSIQAFAIEQIKKYPEEAAKLLLESSFTNNSTQIVNIFALLKTVLFNVNWNSPKALNSLVKICLTHTNKEIAQLIFNVIEMYFQDWTSSQYVKSLIKNIKYTAKLGKGHNSQIANEMLTKVKGASLGNRLLVTFSGSKQLIYQITPTWCELEILEKGKPSKISSSISSDKIAGENEDGSILEKTLKDVKLEDFFSFAGIKIGIDTIDKAYSIYGKPSSISDEKKYDFVSVYYDYKGVGIFDLSYDRITKKIDLVRVKNSIYSEQYFKTAKIEDIKLGFLNKDKNFIISCFGNPDRISYGNYEFRGNKFLIDFICYDQNQHKCSQIYFQYFG